MFGKLTAASLIVLTLSPFTAPFPTCDLTIFLTEHAAPPTHGTSQATSQADSLPSPALPLFRASGRIRFIALSESKTTSDGSGLARAALVPSLRPANTSAPRISLTILRI